jgi:hypothetical protein
LSLSKLNHRDYLLAVIAVIFIKLAMTERDRPMSIFRCRFVDREGQTVFTTISNADDLNSAKHNAFDTLCGKDLSLVMKVHGVEIYKEEQCVYPGRSQARSGAIWSAKYANPFYVR